MQLREILQQNTYKQVVPQITNIIYFTYSTCFSSYQKRDLAIEEGEKIKQNIAFRLEPFLICTILRKITSKRSESKTRNDRLESSKCSSTIGKCQFIQSNFYPRVLVHARGSRFYSFFSIILICENCHGVPFIGNIFLNLCKGKYSRTI